MKKKKNIIIICVIVTCTVAIAILLLNINLDKVDLTPSELIRDELKLDQEDTYIAISKNDISGYNRWIPFYLSMEYSTNDGAEAVENLLNDNITEVALFDNKGNSLFSTKEQLWSAYQVGENSYNLSLVVAPDLSELPIAGVTQIEKLVLYLGNDILEYSLANYLIEERDTVPENEAYTTLSTTDTKIQDTMIANVNYGLYCNPEYVKSFTLDYPSDFARIEKYEIINIENEGTTELKYDIALHFSAAIKKVVFRPFIKISNSDNSGWVVPSLPTYIN